MNTIYILLAMIFLHIVDDYYLQGILASMKQKEWWKENPFYLPMYRHDYIIALIMHSFSWAFMIMLPLAYMMEFNINTAYIVVFVANVIIHAVTDNAKANKKNINLVIDQSIHIVQIVLTWLIMKGR